MRALTLALLLIASPAYATVYVPVDFSEMVTTSKFIVHGRVIDVHSEPTMDRSAIATYITIEVEQPLKGNARDSITFRVPGGEVGRYRRVVVGAPRFTRGDEVIVFLTSRGPSIPFLFGLSQGVYRVSRATGRALVTPLVLTAEGAEAGRVVRGDPARRPLALDDFAREVRAVVERVR
jgi:hypothetical protein